MKRLLTATLLTGLLVVACGKDAKPLVDAAEKYQKDSCACKDVDCLKKAADEYTAATKKLVDQKLEPTEEQAQKIVDASEKAVACNTELAAKMATDAAQKAMPAGLPGQ